MWVRIVLLIIYIVLLFVIARLLEAFAWYDAGLLAHRLLDPMTLSVKKLKALLEQRGVGYEGIVEKKELTGLVEATGLVTNDEVLEVGDMEDSAEVTNFTSGYDFYEQVEDTKDSVWLVQVIARGHNASVINNASWKSVRKKVAKFGVRAGVMDCSLDWNLCRNKGWYSSQVILSLPENFKTKANVVMYVYNGPAKPNSMFKWVKNKLNRKVKQIADYDELKREWLSFQKKYEIRVVLFTELASIPLIFSALSVKFPGRVRFGTMNSKSGSGKESLARLKLKPPACFVIAPGKTLVYGSRPGELLTFRSMENFLKSLYPEVNDFFILSMMVTNLMGWFELFLSQGSVFRRLLRLICCCIKYNIVLIILWQPLLALSQLSYVEILLEWGLLALHFLSGSSIGSIIRKDLIFYSSSRYLLSGTFFLYSILVGYIQYRRKNGMVDQGEFDWFDFAQLLNFSPLLNPSFQMVHPGGVYAMYLLESSDMLFGHFPDLVVAEMQSAVSSEYIKHLPRWKYGRVLQQQQQQQQSSERLKCCRRDKDDDHDDDDDGHDEVVVGATAPIDIRRRRHRLHRDQNPAFCSGPSEFVGTAGENRALQMMDGNYCCDCMQRSAHTPEPRVSASQTLPLPPPPPPLPRPPPQQTPPPPPPPSDVSEETQCDNKSTQGCGSLRKQRASSSVVCSDGCNTTASSSTICSDACNTTATSAVSSDGCNTSATSVEASTNDDDQCKCKYSSQCTTAVAAVCKASSCRESSGAVVVVASAACNSANYKLVPDGYLQSSQCVICLEDFAVGAEICGLPCAHFFHECCILRWLYRTSYSCPICRWLSYNPKPGLDLGEIFSAVPD
ncbi:E3 ubiquitin-protein ligase RNF103-like [Argonauta hians]